MGDLTNVYDLGKTVAVTVKVNLMSSAEKTNQTKPISHKQVVVKQGLWVITRLHLFSLPG